MHVMLSCFVLVLNRRKAETNTCSLPEARLRKLTWVSYESAIHATSFMDAQMQDSR